jgi:hypothetical protein
MVDKAEARTRAMARDSYKTHIMREAPTRSFRFTQPDGSSNYHFTLTWTPGMLALSGDVGELTLVHYHAMPTFEKAIGWVCGAQYDYLMGKSNVREEYYAPGTAEWIVQWANEEPLDRLLGRKRYDNKDQAMWGKRRGDGFLRQWRKLRNDLVPDVNSFDWDFDENPFIMGLIPGSWPRPKRGLREWEDWWTYDDCWLNWLRIWRATRGQFYYPDSTKDLPTMVLSAAGRRKLKKDIQDAVCDAHSAYQFCQEIGLEDFYGDRRYPDQTIWQIEAIKHGCALIQATFPPVPPAQERIGGGAVAAAVAGLV